MKWLLLICFFVIASTAAFAQISAVEWYNKGKKAQGEKNYKQAILLFKKAAQTDKNLFDAWYEMGWCQNELNLYSDAILSLTQAEQLKPGNANVNFEMGFANEKKDNITDAIFFYRKSVAANKYYAGAWYRKGWCENQIAAYDSAYTSCTNAINNKAGYKEAYDELGFAAYKLKRNDEAVNAYRTSISLDGTSSVGYNGMGDIYKSNYNNYDSAIYYYSKAFEKKPTGKKAPYCIGWCYNEKQQFETAITYLKKAIALDENYNTARTELGYAHYKLKNYDEALIQFTKIISSDSKDELSRYYAGFCYYLKSDQSSLRRMIEQLRLINTSTSLKYVETLKQYVK